MHFLELWAEPAWGKTRRVAQTMFYKNLQRFSGFVHRARKCKNLDVRQFEHSFLKISVSICTFWSFGRSYHEVKRAGSPKPCFTSVYEGFLGSAVVARKSREGAVYCRTQRFWTRILHPEAPGPSRNMEEPRRRLLLKNPDVF